ncbi:vinculin-like isoform X10 [Asterias rubens]|uniref:vinculin-like isoform X10 n=1 Tax=Asterias rubens TaxID=7604 RepID=UPI0014553920|nr:vinculin-like isoform X10 [Asterias rubens]
MPTTSYRTKTIHSILDPVAQQVGQLVILHEQAEDGNAMSDLTSPIKIVAQAVSNLVAVGKQTASTSKDEILRREMPPTFQMVERSSGLLVDASHMLQADPYSVPARKKLIDGARGILQGTSDLLFVFDESEVRKIVKICEQVLQLLAVSEVVDTMADILTFVQSLTPGATSMNGQVSARREELINASHAAQLAQHTEQFQKLIPLLVSSMKIYVFIVQDNKPGKQEAWENRTYIASKMIYHIQEIIRVLLAVDDDSFRVDDVTGLRAAQNHIRNNMEKARGWLGDPNAAPGGMGEKALRRILEDARKVASGLDGPQRAAIEQAIDEITAMTNELADLRAKGQGNSPRALQLASAINGKLANLQAQIDAAIAEVLKSSMGKLAYTAGGKMAQAKEWLNNPGVDDRGVGYRAIKDIIETGRKIAATCDDMGQRNELLRLCNETEALAKHLKDLCDKGQGNTPQAEAAAKKLSEKLGKLKEKMTEIVMGQVSSDFLDPMAAVQKLQEAALAPEGTPNREGTFTSRANIFLTNTNKAADTAARFADIADADKDTVDEINRLSNQVKELTPQVISAARIVLVNPGNKVAASHLDFMKKEWEGSMRELDAKLTSSLDVPAFMKASEESMKKQTEIAKAAVKQHDPQTFASSISNIALRGKNMVKVAKREADNSEDPEFKQKVDIASDKLTDCIPPTVLTGKQLMQDMGNPDKMANWQDANNKLMTSVAELKVPFIFVIPLQEYYPPPPPVPAPPPAQMGRAQPANQMLDSAGNVRQAFVMSQPPVEDMSNLRVDHAPPRPPLPQGEIPPPRPPPPEEETEAHFPREPPPSNQPIMKAAYDLHLETQKWSSQGNDLIAAAKKMAILMAQMSKHVRGEGGSKKDFIMCARMIAKQSGEVVRLANMIADQCTDKRIRLNMKQVIERIPTFSTQLKILTTVKATMLGSQDEEKDEEATEMLIGNAQNLMQAVKETVRASEAASIKIRTDAGQKLRWVRRNPYAY